jgi:hypothetical protein
MSIQENRLRYDVIPVDNSVGKPVISVDNTVHKN